MRPTGIRRLRNSLKKLKVFRKLSIKDVTESTNDDASLIVRTCARPHGTIVAASNQTAGRGRGGGKWISFPDSGITASFILKNPFPPVKHFFPTIVAAVAIRDFLDESHGLVARIKWPNDILVKGRKIAGILVENEWGMSIIGIGLNLNQDPSSIPGFVHTATSVVRETGRISDWHDMLVKLASCLEKTWLRSIKFPETIFTEWKEGLLIPRGKVSVNLNKSVLTGKISGVQDDGGLRLRTSDGWHIITSCDSIQAQGRQSRRKNPHV